MSKQGKMPIFVILSGKVSVFWSSNLDNTEHPINAALSIVFKLSQVLSQLIFWICSLKANAICPIDSISIPSANVKIGNNVFAGANSTILPGVKIGDGAVIGAGAVVVKDIPEGAVAGGNPAKVLKFRNLENFNNSTKDKSYCAHVINVGFCSLK